MYLKIGDIRALLELHVETKHWDEVWCYIASSSFESKNHYLHIFQSDIFYLKNISWLF